MQRSSVARLEACREAKSAQAFIAPRCARRLNAARILRSFARLLAFVVDSPLHEVNAASSSRWSTPRSIRFTFCR